MSASGGLFVIGVLLSLAHILGLFIITARSAGVIAALVALLIAGIPLLARLFGVFSVGYGEILGNLFVASSILSLGFLIPFIVRAILRQLGGVKKTGK